MALPIRPTRSASRDRELGHRSHARAPGRVGWHGMQGRDRLFAVGCGLLCASLLPAPQGLLLVALPLGYGHLLGAWLFARSRARPTVLDTAFTAVSVLTLLCAYT